MYLRDLEKKDAPLMLEWMTFIWPSVPMQENTWEQLA